jgi:hypothetical protein
MKAVSTDCRVAADRIIYLRAVIQFTGDILVISAYRPDTQRTIVHTKLGWKLDFMTLKF